MSPITGHPSPLVTRSGLTGLLDRFCLLGPFNKDGKATPCDALRTDYLGEFGGEKGLDVERFRRAAVPYVIGAGFKVNLVPLARASGSIVYALAILKSEAAQPAVFRLGSDKGYKLILNNEEIGYLDAHRGLAPDENEHSVRLRKGVNLVLMKVEYVFGGYEFALRVEAKRKIVQLFDMPEGYPAETLRFTDEGAQPVDFTRRLKYCGPDYFTTLAEALEPKLAFKARNRKEMARWHTALHRRLRALMGPEPPRDNRPPLVLSEEEIEGGLVRQKVVLRSYKDSDVPCYLLRPRKPAGKVPGVIALHGHGPGNYPVAGVTFGAKSLRDWLEGVNYDYGLKVAREGFVVICPTARGFGERGTEFAHACDVFALKASLMGMNLLALNLYDYMRCIDYLHTLPFVSTERTGCVGLSNGGTFAYHLAALDTRLTATIVSGAIGSWRGEMWHSYACGNQVLHGILQYADIADITSLIAPRALCVESGLYDSCAMSPAFLAAHEVLRRAWRVAGCSDRLCIDVFPGPHRFHGDLSIPFLRKHLGL